MVDCNLRIQLLKYLIDWLVSFLLRDGSMITLLRSSLYTSLLDQSKDWEEAFYFSNIPEISSLRNKKWGPENMYTFSMFVYIVKVYYFWASLYICWKFCDKVGFYNQFEWIIMMFLVGLRNDNFKNSENPLMSRIWDKTGNGQACMRIER